MLNHGILVVRRFGFGMSRWTLAPPLRMTPATQRAAQHNSGRPAGGVKPGVVQTTIPCPSSTAPMPIGLPTPRATGLWVEPQHCQASYRGWQVNRGACELVRRPRVQSCLPGTEARPGSQSGYHLNDTGQASHSSPAG